MHDRKGEGITSKVRDDVTTTMSSGVRPESVYEFCTCDVAVSKRHKLQGWARATYEVQLEIIDGAAVAELLCAHDLFWLAERYLQVPSELLPALPTGKERKDWYASTLEKWRRETRPARTFADFAEIRAAAREALGPFTCDDQGKHIHRYELPELPYWIERLEEIGSQGTVASLRRRSLYETVVLRLRGLGSLAGQEDRLRQFFDEIPQLRDAADLEDAEVLLSYVLPESRLWRIRLGDSDVMTWLRALERLLDNQLRNAKKHNMFNEYCALLEVRGHTAQVRRLSEGSADATETLKHWSKLAKSVVRAPLFPLERFADRLAQFARYIGSHPNYEPLTKKVDALLAERFGQFKAAEKCLERAIAFRKAGDLSRAIAQLHRAEIDWFAEETLGKALLALNYLSDAYSEQNLQFAAKYYALAAAYIALNAKDLRLKRLVALGLERAASCDYALGAWHGFFELAEAAAIVYPHFPHDFEADFNKRDGMLQHLMFYLVVVPTATKLLRPSLDAFARERSRHISERLNLAVALEQLLSDAEKEWALAGAQELWKSIEEQLAGPPWSDAGAARRAQWRAHGIAWNIEWNNDYETTLAAEEFLAVLQVFLSDLAGQDLCFMRLTINISIRLASEDAAKVVEERDYKGFDVMFKPSNTERIGIVTLPPYRLFRDGLLTREDLQAGALGVASRLLTEVSLLPVDRFYKILNERFKEGLQTKLLVGATYGRCLREFVSQKAFEASERSSRARLEAPPPFVSRIPEKLPWHAGPGPGYDSQEAQQQARNRYEGFSHPIARTLQRLKKELPFRLAISHLRAAGWKDWHILSAVYHVTMNYRLNHICRTLGSTAEMAASMRLPHEPEREDALPVPLEEYEEKNLRQQLHMFVIAFAETHKLELHQPTPDFSAIEDFLAHRYNFWTDDVEHSDPFEL
jgi:hypothetical protein